MLTLFERHDEDWRDRLRAWVGRHRAATAALVVAALLLIVGVLGYNRFAYMQRPDPDFDAGVARPTHTGARPRVLFDAAHFNFHKADGNYKPFADLIRNDGHEVVSNSEPFRVETLAGFQVLVIANPLGGKGVLGMLANLVGFKRALYWDLEAFTPEECDAVRDWVAAGGGLLLIADHAPTGSEARALAGRFGVDMSNAFTEDDQHSDPDAYGWLVFTRANGLLLSHPVTEGRGPEERLNQVTTFTGQSLKGPEGAVPFLSLADTARDYPTRDSTFAEGNSAAGRAQGVALRFGRGRVVVLGGAAMLSAQVFRGAGRELRLGMRYPQCDNRQLALNIMHWLSGLPD